MTRQLVIFDDVEGTMLAVDPQLAPGVAVPAFRYGTTRPPAGATKGEAFINQTTGIASVWDGTNWTDIAKPVVIPYPDDATLLADNPPNETIALSRASGNIFTRINNTWMPLGARVYPTQAGLVADTPPPGTIAYAVDTGEFAVRVTGNWATLTNQGVNVGATTPNAPLVGNQWFDVTTKTLFTWDGANWVPPTSGVPLGTIITHASVNPPTGYLLCDGSPIPAGNQFDSLRAIIGANVPDLTDQFIRGTDSQSDIDGFNKHQDTTRRPRNDFTVHASGNTSSSGNHRHSFTRHGYNTDGGWAGGDAIWTVSRGGSYTVTTNTTGNHHHSVSIDGTVNGGGDTETAPAHIRLAHHIKAF